MPRAGGPALSGRVAGLVLNLPQAGGVTCAPWTLNKHLSSQKSEGHTWPRLGGRADPILQNRKPCCMGLGSGFLLQVPLGGDPQVEGMQVEGMGGVLGQRVECGLRCVGSKAGALHLLGRGCWPSEETGRAPLSWLSQGQDRGQEGRALLAVVPGVRGQQGGSGCARVSVTASSPGSKIPSS